MKNIAAAIQSEVTRSLTPALALLGVIAVGCGDDPSDQKQAPTAYVQSIDFNDTNTMFVDHRTKMNARLSSRGNGEEVTALIGLVEADPTGSKPATELTSCQLESRRIKLPGHDQALDVEFVFTVKKSCAPGKSYNFWISYDFDGASGIPATTVIYDEPHLQDAPNQACRKAGDKSPGCVYKIAVKDSPGIDAELVDIVPSSTIAVLHEQATAAGLRTELLAVGSEVAIHGRASGSNPAQTYGAKLTYEIAPMSEPTNWQPLVFVVKAGEQSESEAVPALRPHSQMHMSHHLQAPTAVLDMLLTGAWSQLHKFQIRACVHVDTSQIGDPALAGADGKANDCKTLPIKIIRASGSLNDSNAVSYLSYDYAWSQTYGSSSSITLTPSVSTNNVIDLTGNLIPQYNNQPQQGAASLNDATVSVGGDIGSLLGSSPLLQIDADAVAYVAVEGSYVSIDIQSMGSSIYSNSVQVNTGSPLYSQDWNQMVNQTWSDTFWIDIVPVTVSFSASGTIGLTATLDLGNSGVQGQSGQGGAVIANVNPYAALSVSASAGVGDSRFSAGVTGTLNLVQINQPAMPPTPGGTAAINASIDWGINNLSPLTITGSANLAANIAVNTLSGDVQLYATYPDGLHECGPHWYDGVCLEENTSYLDLFCFSGVTFVEPLVGPNTYSYTVSL